MERDSLRSCCVLRVTCLELPALRTEHATRSTQHERSESRITQSMEVWQ